MGTLRAPRFAGDDVLASCLDGHRIFDGSGDPPDTIMRIQQALFDIGANLAVDGIFATETGNAVTAFKDSKGILPDDPVVGPQTMAALDNDFANELFDLKAAELAGGPFDLGQRTGDRVDVTDGVATCEFDNGLVVELIKILTFAVPTTVVGAWNGAGGLTGEAGIPLCDPFIRDAGTTVQHFVGASMFTDGSNPIVLTPAVSEVVDWIGTGSPTGGPGPSPAGGSVVPCTDGVIFDRGDGTAIPLPQAVFDAWLPAAGQLGMPTALGFADTAATTVFPFTGGSLVLAAAGGVSAGGAVGAPGRRFFLPPDPARHLQPPVSGSGVEHVLGGATALGRMRGDVASAAGPADFVYLAGWNCELDLQLPVPPGSPISTIRTLFSTAGGAGVQVRAQLWASDPTVGLPLSVERVLADPLMFARGFILPLMPQAVNNLATVSFVEHLGGDAAGIIDDRYLPFGSHHQKILVVFSGGQLVAYVGGIEFTSDRLLPVSKGAPLFDTSIRLTGPAALEVLRTFTERWEAHPSAHGAALRGDALLAGPPPAAGSVTVQITHTYGRGCPYPVAVQTAAAARAQALIQAQNFFYMEDQYFVGSVAQGAAMRVALVGGAVGIVVLAAEDSVADLPDIAFRRRQFLAPLVSAFPANFFVFERLGAGSTTGPGAYVHSKLLVVDDEAAFVGSVNSNRRSWSHDTEVDAVCVDDNGPGDPSNASTWGFARRLRTDLWAAHLGVSAASIGDGAAAVALWQQAAAGTLASASVRRYDALATVPRFSPPGLPIFLIPLLPRLLDFAWDSVEDPIG